MKWLITSFDSRPQLRGGIATFNLELTKALAAIPNQNVELVVPSCAGAIEFDKNFSFTTRRVDLPCNSMLAIFPLTRFLRKIIKTQSPDHILNFLWLPDATSTYFSGTKKYSIVAHGVEILEASSTFKKRLRNKFSPIKKKVFRNAKFIFVVSRFTGDWVQRECGVNKDKIVLLHPGVDLNQWPDVERMEKPIQNFFTITRLVDYKGIDKVLEAMALLKKHHTHWQYKIAGEGVDRVRLEKMIQDLNLSEHVSFLGAIDDDSLKQCYAEADVFIMCSREDWTTPNVEGFGIVFLEAAACSLPSIAGRSGGISDAVVDGETGWLVEPENVLAIYKTLDEVVKNPSEVRRRGKAARARVEKDFQWKHVAERIMLACNNVRD